VKKLSEMNLKTLISTQQATAKSEGYGEQAEAVVNRILVQLKNSKSGWRSAFKSQAEVDGYKEQLLQACFENGIRTEEMINKGLEQARKDPSDFLPSVGKFITWCKPQDHHEHLAIDKATREFDANRKLLDNKTHDREYAKEQIRKIKSMVETQKQMRELEKGERNANS
jgi:hypothetical protein